MRMSQFVLALGKCMYACVTEGLQANDGSDTGALLPAPVLLIHGDMLLLHSRSRGTMPQWVMQVRHDHMCSDASSVASLCLRSLGTCPTCLAVFLVGAALILGIDHLEVARG